VGVLSPKGALRRRPIKWAILSHCFWGYPTTTDVIVTTRKNSPEIEWVRGSVEKYDCKSPINMLFRVSAELFEPEPAFPVVSCETVCACAVTLSSSRDVLCAPTAFPLASHPFLVAGLASPSPIHFISPPFDLFSLTTQSLIPPRPMFPAKDTRHGSPKQ